MSINENTDTAQQKDGDGVLSFTELLDVLSFTDGEFVSICHKQDGGNWHAAIRPANNGPAFLATLPVEADIYFGVNPVPTKIKGRGKNGDSTENFRADSRSGFQSR